ncbi:MAG: NADH-quinone oxidoreductase subunit J [Planctomycetes bacterium]|nr:NADH-quinone oxidoreductase subunit J [Planctomycetota bacterium]
MTFSDGAFWVFAATAVLPAAGILLSRSIVRMAFLLLVSLAGFAGLYLQLGAGFLGFTQVLVYIGGILILFLFGLMLTARFDVHVRRRVGAGVIVPGVIAGLSLLGVLVFLALESPWSTEAGAAAAAAGAGDTFQIGLKVLGPYVLPFEAVTVLLLVAMVGATYIGRAQMPGTPAEGERKE